MKNILQAKSISDGIQINFRNKKYQLKYPRKIWQNYSNKQELMQNYIPLATISLPLMLNLKKIHYNLPKSEFQDNYKDLFLKDLPSSTFDNKQNAVKLTQKFNQIKFIFKKRAEEIKYNKKQSKNTKHKAIIPLSLGKDSLLTFSVAREIGLNPISIYVNDTITPKENNKKIEFGKKFAKEFRQKHYFIENTIEKLNDFETWNKPETNFNYSHMITGFSFIALPFVQNFGSRYIIMGNEQDMNFSFVGSQGLRAWPAYDQTEMWQEEQNKIIKKLTNNKTQVTSIIRPLTNIAIFKILYGRYSEKAKYEFSCDCLNASFRRRWCHDCSKCARHFLFMKAFGVNAKKMVGLSGLFQKQYKKFYSLFDGKEVDRYEQNIESKEQQLLAFLLAMRNKSKGHLIEFFKKNYLKEALAQEDNLRKKYFSLWPAKIPRELKNDVLSIYREELRSLG